MLTPWLSILIPVFNVEDYLEECLHSVISQIDSSVEIILVDDGSTDNSLAIAKKVAELSPHEIKIIQHKKNGGLSAARNTLIEAASGEYIWFLDSDDTLVASAVAKIKKIVDQYCPDLIMFHYAVWKYKENIRTPSVSSFYGKTDVINQDPFSLFYGLYRRGKLHSCTKVSKRALWSELRFPVGRYFEDVYTTHKLAYNVRSFYYSPEAFYNYRHRDGSITKNFNTKKIQDWLSANVGVLDFWRSKGGGLPKRCRDIFIWYCVKSYINAMKEAGKSNCLNEENREIFRKLLFDAVPLKQKKLIFFLLARGRLIMLIRLLFLIYRV